MQNNNFFNSFFRNIKKSLKKFRRFIRKSGREHPRVFERSQLSTIFFLATTVFIYLVKNALGSDLPDMFYKFFPFLSTVLDIQLLKIFANPEKTFVFYLIILEVMINRPRFNFSMLVKFNVLLIFLFEMSENLLLTIWDLFSSRELETFYQGMVITYITYIFFFVFFTTFFSAYVYCYFCAMRGRFPKFSGKARFLQPLVDSVGFWLRVNPSSDSPFETEEKNKNT